MKWNFSFDNMGPLSHPSLDAQYSGIHLQVWNQNDFVRNYDFYLARIY